MASQVDVDIQHLLKAIQRLGQPSQQQQQQLSVPFGTLFKDDEVANTSMQFYLYYYYYYILSYIRYRI
jgi:hypothetical protein